MIEIHGIYDGDVVRPLEPVEAEANTPVVIQFPGNADPLETLDDWLIKAGLMLSKPSGEPLPDFEPLEIEGPPLSQTIIEERRDRF